MLIHCFIVSFINTDDAARANAAMLERQGARGRGGMRMSIITHALREVCLITVSREYLPLISTSSESPILFLLGAVMMTPIMTIKPLTKPSAMSASVAVLCSKY
eukprot:3507430-Rhodomonas_salina.5